MRSLATTQYASKVGLRVSDQQLSRAFREEEAFQVDGRFNLQAARARLAAAGLTEEGFVRELRQSLLANQLMGVIGASDFLTPAEGKRILALLDEERELRFVLLQPESFASKAAPDAAAIQAWYEAHQDQFTVPESVRLAYAELSLADIASGIEVDEAQVQARYERDKASYQRPETRRASHILITVDGSTDDAKAKAQATEGGFAAAMSQALKSVSGQQMEAQRLQRELQLDNPAVSLEQTMVAMQKAQIGFQAALAVRNQFVRAYTDIMNMQV